MNLKFNSAATYGCTIDHKELKALRKRYANYARQAEKWEYKRDYPTDKQNLSNLTDLTHYDFSKGGIQIIPAIDFIVVRMHLRNSLTGTKLKELLTKAQLKIDDVATIDNISKPYVEALDVVDRLHEKAHDFVVTIQDVKSIDELNQRLAVLDKHGFDIHQTAILRVELSLDFWNAPTPLLLALLKSLKLNESTHNMRLYRGKNDIQFFEIRDNENHRRPAPNTHLELVDLIEDGYTIGINHRDSPLAFRAYKKVTDKQGEIQLPVEQHRLRLEVNVDLKLEGSMLPQLGKVIQEVGKNFSFLRLKRSAVLDEQIEFDRFRLHGMAVTPFLDNSRNKRTVSPIMEPFTDLNDYVRQAIKNLARKF